MSYSLKDMSITISGDNIQFCDNNLAQIIGNKKEDLKKYLLTST